ncbi:hypothetical protein [Desulfovibrio fairfieldensis]|uniref:hypothetical protein n=1 Tax=Desulfovibrio fairfieldensis TaxID=44742 RepID=UPI00123714D0|nr:hypothetical protein [Desulfovibrio fairfieldensis]
MKKLVLRVFARFSRRDFCPQKPVAQAFARNSPKSGGKIEEKSKREGKDPHGTVVQSSKTNAGWYHSFAVVFE